MDKTFHVIMKHMVETGQALNYTEEDRITPPSDLMKLFSGKIFRRRFDFDYFSHMYGIDFILTIKEICKTDPFGSFNKSIVF